MESTANRGQRIAQRFELDALLSDVGLGECWSAQDLQRPDSPAQVEFLSAPTASGPATREAFEAHITRLRPVSNPGLLGVIAGAEVDGRLVVVTERLEGRSLSNWIAGHKQAGTRPSFTVVQRIFDKVCNAMQFAHGVSPQPVVHRALTPRSILLRRMSPGQHHVKVGDFGLAPFSPGARTGTIGAWWEYQAPEQHGGRWNEPPTADVFALAVVLTELLTLSALPRSEGRETWWQYVKESRASAADRLLQLRQDVPRAVWEAIGAAMKPSPKERTASVQRFQRAVRDAWQAAGEWQTTAGTEAEPPTPTSVSDNTSLVRAAPGAYGSGTSIDGWQAPERLQVPQSPTRPSMPDPAPARSSEPLMHYPEAPFATPVDPPQWQPAPANAAPALRQAVSESTEMIDLAQHGAFTRPSIDSLVRQESTMALDIASLDPRSFAHPANQYGTVVEGQHPSSMLFGDSFEGGSDLDPGVGTQVMSQPLGGDTEPPPPDPYDDVPPPDASNTTRAIDTAEAFAQLDRQAGRPPAAAMATMKAPVSSRGFKPTAPRRDPVDPDLLATRPMQAIRPATMAPNGFFPSAVQPGGDPSGDPFARPSLSGDPFGGDPFRPASSVPSQPPVEPTMAIPIEAMLAGSQPPYGRPSNPGAPMPTAFAMGAPPRTSESLSSPKPASTIAGQPAWIMIAIGLLIIVSVGASAFLLSGGR